jgi:hypothetical protein
MNGHTRSFTVEDLDNVVDSYNPGYHEAPLVIGHPIDNAPAFGWVAELKRQGDILLARVKDIVPEFAEAVQSGLYKKRSISLYPNMVLRHVGFLGAMPPAVKGLENIAFREELLEAQSYEFAEYRSEEKFSLLSRVMRRIREYLIEKDGSEKANNIISESDIDWLQVVAKEDQLMYVENSPQEDIELLKKLETQLAEANQKIKKLEEEKSSLAAQFAEATKPPETDYKAEYEKKVAELNQLKEIARKEAHVAFCDSMITAGKMIPAEKDTAVEIMVALDQGENFQFSEGNDDNSSVAKYRKQFETRKPHALFAEQATKQRAVAENTDFSEAASVGKRITEHMFAEAQKGRKITYAQALQEVKQ